MRVEGFATNDNSFDYCFAVDVDTSILGQASWLEAVTRARDKVVKRLGRRIRMRVVTSDLEYREMLEHYRDGHWFQVIENDVERSKATLHRYFAVDEVLFVCDPVERPSVENHGRSSTSVTPSVDGPHPTN